MNIPFSEKITVNIFNFANLCHDLILNKEFRNLKFRIVSDK